MFDFYEALLKNNYIDIYLPYSNAIMKYRIPDSYYINPKGLLYNGFGEHGHKEANMGDTYKLIKDSVYNLTEKIDLYDLLCEEKVNYNRLLHYHVTRGDVMNYLHMDCNNLEDPLLNELVLGMISSRISLLEKFIELEQKDDKLFFMNKVITAAHDDLNDILVRYVGFHKVEVKQKTITTTSINISAFIKYLDHNFKIDVLPPIRLDDKNDEEHRNLMIDRFLDDNPYYVDKVKKLTR